MLNCSLFLRVLIKSDIMYSWLSAVGKSTFARLLQSASPDWEVMAEPVSKWQNIESGTKKVVHISWTLYAFVKNRKQWGQADDLLLCLLTGERRRPPDDSQQPAADDVPGPQALVVHLSDVFLYEPAENAAAASSRSPAQLRGNTCPGVWALSLQRQVSESGQRNSNQVRGTTVLGP